MPCVSDESDRSHLKSEKRVLCSGLLIKHEERTIEKFI